MECVQRFKEAFLESPWARRFGDTNIHRIAGIAGVEWSELIHQHSMLPYRWAISPEGIVDLRHCDRDVSVIRTMAFAVPRDGVAFCPCCVGEDVDFHGFSIWRREHQLPGAYWCLKHGAALIVVPQAAALAMLQSPASHLASGEHSVPTWVIEAPFSPPIRRVLEIESFLLGRKSPLAAGHLLNVARARAKNLGLRTDGFGSGPLLSDLVQDKFAHAWLMASFPPALNPIENANCRYIDLAIHHHKRQMGPIAYAIMFASMWDTTDDALNAMLKVDAQPRHRKRVPAARPTDQAIRDAYKQQLGSRKRMIRTLGTSYEYLSGRLRHLGLPVLEGKQKMALADFLFDGLSIETASQQWEVPASDLEALVRDALSPLRGVLIDLMTREPANSRLMKKKRAIQGQQAKGRTSPRSERALPMSSRPTTTSTGPEEGLVASSTRKPPRTSRRASSLRTAERRRGSRLRAL